MQIYCFVSSSLVEAKNSKKNTKNIKSLSDLIQNNLQPNL